MNAKNKESPPLPAGISPYISEVAAIGNSSSYHRSFGTVVVAYNAFDSTVSANDLIIIVYEKKYSATRCRGERLAEYFFCLFYYFANFQYTYDKKNKIDAGV